jgi:hypothetical protein
MDAYSKYKFLVLVSSGRSRCGKEASNANSNANECTDGCSCMYSYSYNLGRRCVIHKSIGDATVDANQRLRQV